MQLAESHAFSIVGAQRMEKFRAEVMHVADVLTAAVERSGTDGAFFVNPRDLLNAALKDSA